jgi:hypothetical protein
MIALYAGFQKLRRLTLSLPDLSSSHLSTVAPPLSTARQILPKDVPFLGAEICGWPYLHDDSLLVKPSVHDTALSQSVKIAWCASLFFVLIKLPMLKHFPPIMYLTPLAGPGDGLGVGGGGVGDGLGGGEGLGGGVGPGEGPLRTPEVQWVWLEFTGVPDLRPQLEVPVVNVK